MSSIQRSSKRTRHAKKPDLSAVDLHDRGHEVHAVAEKNELQESEVRSANMFPKMSLELKNVFCSFDKLHLLGEKGSNYISEADEEEQEEQANTWSIETKQRSNRERNNNLVLPELNSFSPELTGGDWEADRSANNRSSSDAEHKTRTTAKISQMRGIQAYSRKPTWNRLNSAQTDNAELNSNEQQGDKFSPKTRRLLQRSSDLQKCIKTHRSEVTKLDCQMQPWRSLDDQMLYSWSEGLKLDQATGGGATTTHKHPFDLRSARQERWRTARTASGVVHAFSLQNESEAGSYTDHEYGEEMFPPDRPPGRQRSYTIS